MQHCSSQGKTPPTASARGGEDSSSLDNYCMARPLLPGLFSAWLLPVHRKLCTHVLDNAFFGIAGSETIFMQWNMRGLQANREELSLLLSQYHPTAIRAKTRRVIKTSKGHSWQTYSPKSTVVPL